MSATASPHASASIESMRRQPPGWTWTSEEAGTAVAATRAARIAQAFRALRGESCMSAPSKLALLRLRQSASGYGGRRTAQTPPAGLAGRGFLGNGRAHDG